jgi:hypothetical protein
LGIVTINVVTQGSWASMPSATIVSFFINSNDINSDYVKKPFMSFIAYALSESAILTLAPWTVQQ